MRRFRIGTRGSPLALAQAREAATRIAAAQGWTAEEADSRLETVIIRTTGDRITDRPLAEAGGKGLFIKELEEALADSRIDLAVHSMKDVPGVLPPGFAIAAALPREDPRDALIGAASVAALKPGARVGTTSPRRKSQLLSLRPDLAVVLFRGNVQTRLDKLARGEADATLLAMAGLNRLGLTPRLTPLDPEIFLPAAGQGVIGLESRDVDTEALALAASVNDVPASLALAAERACLAVLDGSCRSAIGIHAAPGGNNWFILRATVFALDGSERHDVAAELDHTPTPEESADLGRRAGDHLKPRAAHLLT